MNVTLAQARALLSQAEWTARVRACPLERTARAIVANTGRPYDEALAIALKQEAEAVRCGATRSAADAQVAHWAAVVAELEAKP